MDNNTLIKPLTDEELDRMTKEHNKGAAFVKQIAADQQCWDAGIVVRKGCLYMDKPSYHIYLEQLADEKIKKLQSYYPTLEWLAYLVGEVDHEKQEVIVTDLIIPDFQQVTSVNVHNVEYSWNEGKIICGVIHSHHGMGAFFSGTDDAYINQNHDVSIVVSTSPHSPIQGQVRVKAPCGDYVLAEKESITFSVRNVSVLDESEFEKEFTSKINKFSPLIIKYVDKFFGNNRQQLPIYLGDDDPYEMSKEELTTELLKYYSDGEVDIFFSNEEAEEELITIRQLNFDKTSHDLPLNINQQTELDLNLVDSPNQEDNVDQWDLIEVEPRN
ncbi:MAG: hypothetical protein KQ78_01465 [Candidatus Izimaplasma bacterium HR2]|nr:MAG: hypothetical protein KQ78_01465 [Candidatus Izimaplasma bacterium HR2]